MVTDRIEEGDSRTGQADSDALVPSDDAEMNTLVKAFSGPQDGDAATLKKPDDATPASEADVPEHWDVGDVILDTYEVKAKLGEGTFGVVHRVHHKGWNTDLAVKSATGFLDEDEIRKIHREAEVWMELGLHPNIVSCFFVRNLGGSPRIFVEYVEGGTLHEWLYGPPPDSSEETAPMGQREGDSKSGKKPRELTRAQRLAIAIEICRGMHHAHTFKWKDKDGNELEGLIHRDLKPLNILMTEDGTPRVTDFGLVGFGLPTETAASDDSSKTPERADESRIDAGAEADLSPTSETDVTPTIVKPKDGGAQNVTIRKPAQEDESDSYPDFLDPGVGAAQLSIHGGETAGTPQYMAPEQWDPHTPTTKAVDIYAFGVILYEIFCARRPFELPERFRHAMDEFKQSEYERMHREEAPPDPASLSPDVDSELTAIMLRCLEKLPENRPANFADIRDRLKAIHHRLEGEDYDALHPEPKAAELLADSLNNRALSYIELGQDERAEELWEEAQRMDPHHLEVNYNRGLILWHSGRLTDQDLVARLQEVCTTHGESWNYRHLLGMVHMERCDEESAVKVLTEAKQQAPNEADPAKALDTARSLLPNAAECVRTFVGHMEKVTTVCLSADRRWALSGGGSYDDSGPSNDHSVRLWEVETGACLRTFEGHFGEVTSVCLSADGRWALSGSHDKTMRLWNVETGQCPQVFIGHTGGVTSVCLSTDARQALSGSRDMTMRLWNVNVVAGSYVRTFKGHFEEVESVVLSIDGRWALSGSQDTTVRLWDVETGSCFRRFIGHTDNVTSVCLSTDGRWALSGGWDTTMRLWSVETGASLRTFIGHTDWVTSVYLSEDGRWALSGGRDRTMRLWSVETGTCLRTFEGHTRGVTSVCLSADGQWALSGSDDKTMRLWGLAPFAERESSVPAISKVTRWEETKDLSEQLDRLLKQAHAATDKSAWRKALDHICAIQAMPGYARHSEALQLRNYVGRQCVRKDFRYGWHLRTFEGHTRGVTSVCLSADGRWALSGSDDRTLRLWSVESGICLRIFEGHANPVTSVCLSTDGRWALSGSGAPFVFGDTTVRLWDVRTGARLRTFEGHYEQVSSVCLSADGRWALSGGQDKTLQLWSVETGASLRTFEEYHEEYHIDTGPVGPICLSADGRWMLSGSGDKAVRLWSVETGICLRTFEGHANPVTSLCLSADGRWALSGSGDKTVRLWIVETGHCLRTFEGHTRGVTSVCLSADGRWALSGGSDKTVRLWNVETGECLRTFAGQTGAVTSVCLSADGRWALVGSSDKTIRLWELEWEFEVRDPSDWDEGARPHLETFLTLHTPYAASLPADHEPSAAELTRALTREGTSTWTDSDFKQLLDTLGCSGYSWLRPEGVRKELEKMATGWDGPPTLFGQE